jgi:hypothetical protein
MPKDIRHKSSFIAIDETGTRHRLDVFVDIVDTGTLNDPNSDMEGLTRIQTPDGGPVNRLEKGRYQVVASGLIVRSDDPAAP